MTNTTMTIAMRMAVALCIAACLAGNARTEDAVTPDCPLCRNQGFTPCADCRATGQSSHVQQQCPDCDGKKEVPCTTCDDKGMMKCPRKKTRTESGRHMMVNPAWEKNQSDKPFGIREMDTKKRDTEKKKDDKEPPQYIVCSTCEGKGQIKCTACDGTKKMKCPRCRGVGTVDSEGPCPVCQGTGNAPCKGCAALPDDAPDTYGAKVKQLDELLRNKTLPADVYWKQRRSIVAAAKTEVSRLHEREREEESKRTLIENREREQAEKKEDAQARRKAVENLFYAWASDAIPLELYLQKRDTAGLSEKDVRAIEKELATKEKDKTPRMLRFVEIEEQFRAGELTAKQWRDKLDALGGIRR